MYLFVLGMPSHGVDIIDGIPVLLKDGVMYAFQPGQTLNVKLGSYSATTKKAVWDLKEDAKAWMGAYKESLVARSRK